MTEKESEGIVEPTFPCKICSRKFIETSLVKHEPVCKKLSKLDRKPFDSGKQRASGSDISYADVRRAAKEREKLGGVYPRPMTNWKERHETFIDAVSSSKKVDYAIKTGAPLPPPPRTAVPSDYVQCDYCGRNFSEKAAERHIPFCKEQNSMKALNSSARSLSSHRKPIPFRSTTKQESPVERTTVTRGRGESRGTHNESAQTRGKSVDSRSTNHSAQLSSSKNKAQSAGFRQQEQRGIPTPAKRSSSAPKPPAFRLKTPPPISSRLKMKG